MNDQQRVRNIYKVLKPNLNERTKRLFAAAEAKNIGRVCIARLYNFHYSVSNKRDTLFAVEYHLGDWFDGVRHYREESL